MPTSPNTPTTPPAQDQNPLDNTWVNGVTGVTNTGFPPQLWLLGTDGFWYPPGTTKDSIGGVPQTSDINMFSGPNIGGRTLLPYNPTPTGSNTVPAPTPTNPPPVATTSKPDEIIYPINVNVHPAIPVFPKYVLNILTDLTIKPIPLLLNDALVNTLYSLDAGKVNNFFDQGRVLKTVLNFGQDYQALLTNWEYDPRDTSGNTVLVKLYEPLPDPVEEKTPVWISRELSPTVVDRLFLTFTPNPPPLVYLRPRNTNVQIAGKTGQAVQNATYTSLFSSGALNPIAPTDPVIQEWFTEDVNSVELNIAYNDFTQFVFFGSAQARIDAFVQKLLIIENLTNTINMNSASLALTGSANITGSSAYVSLQSIGDERLDMYRTFDGFERFLYYESASAYSSSFHGDPQDEIFVMADVTYPKSGSGVAPVTSSQAQAWYSNLSAIATAYDQQNSDALQNSLPHYIVDEGKSTEFLQFMNLAGHQFDILKTYIDAIPEIYNRDSDPLVKLAPEMVWNVAKSFGIDLPNQYAINNLVDYTIGNSTSNPVVYRNAAAETWKRFLHNQIFMLKTKGTKTALRALTNAFGVLPTTLRVREAAVPGTAFPTGTFEQYDEQTNVVTITSGSYFAIPWTTASLSASTLEVRFSTTDNSVSQSLVTAPNSWGMVIEPLTGSYGRVALRNASGSDSVSSSYFQIYSGDFFSTMVTYAATGVTLSVKRCDNGETFIDDFVGTEPNSGLTVAAKWFTPSTIYLGGSGSFFGRAFAGYVDEFRSWGEVVGEDIFDIHVRYPGMYNGNTNQSPATTLYVRLSFNKAQDLFTTASYANESPFARPSTCPVPFRTIPAINFPHISSYPFNMAVITRNVIRYSPNAGGNQYTTNKVIIAGPPVLTFFSGSTVPVLSPTDSIVSLDDKKDFGVNTNTVGFFFSLTDAINDSMIRTLGVIDLQNLLGDPADQFNSTYSSLVTLDNLYWNQYGYTFNINTFINFVKNLLDPLFLQAEQLIPARAKLLGGIVHEPHILERNKQQNKPLDVSAGSLTRRDHTNTYNLFGDLGTTQPTAISASNITRDAVFSLSQSVIPTATLPFYDARLVTTSSYAVVADYATYDDSSNLKGFIQNLLHIFGVPVVGQLSATQLALYNQYLLAYQNPAAVNTNAVFVSSKAAMSGSGDDFVIDMIEPYTDFTKYQSTVFFTDPNGLVRVPITVFTRVNQNILTNRAVWLYGTNYNRNDFVYQVALSGSSQPGDNTEFLCITTVNPFTSTVAPGLDPKNWRQMTYTPSLQLQLRQALLISSSVSIAPTGSGQPFVVGYRPEHFYKTRDQRQRVNRGYFLGCLQTSGSTPDGQPPVTVTFSAGDTLVVRNPGAPVQPTNNSSGPLLDVT